MIVMRENLLGHGVSIINEALTKKTDEFLTKDFIRILSMAHRRFGPKLNNIIMRYNTAQDDQKDDASNLLDFIKPLIPVDGQRPKDQWKVGPLPKDLIDRRVEISGPANIVQTYHNLLPQKTGGWPAKRVIFDLDETMKSSWHNLIESFHQLAILLKGEMNLDRVSKNHSNSVSPDQFIDPNTIPPIGIKIRSITHKESNLLIDGEKVSAGLLDLALTICHLGPLFTKLNKTPLIYISHCYNSEFAGWINDVVSFMEEKFQFIHGLFKIQLLVDSLSACYQLEEILYELKNHATGLTLGRPHRIFRQNKKAAAPITHLPLDFYQTEMKFWGHENLIKNIVNICHSHDCYALLESPTIRLGKDQQTSIDLVNEYYENLFTIGVDGVIISTPSLVPHILKAATHKNQLDTIWDESEISHDNLLRLPQTQEEIDLNGLNQHIRLSIIYQHAWNHGHGQISLDNNIHDYSSIVHTRSQIWQCYHFGKKLQDGTILNKEWIKEAYKRELQKILDEIDLKSKLPPEKYRPAIEEWEKAKNEAEEHLIWCEWNEFIQNHTELA